MGFNHFTVAFTAEKRIYIVNKQDKNYIAKTALLPLGNPL